MKRCLLRHAVAVSMCMSLGFIIAGNAQTLEKIDKSLQPKPGGVTPPHPHKNPPPRNARACIFDPVGDIACYAGGVAFFYGGIVSWERATGNIPQPEIGQLDYSVRMIGEPMIPLLRLDGQWVRTDGSISVLDTRLEAGFGPIAFDIRNAAFQEDGVDGDLTLTRWHLLYRMSFSNTLEVDLGVGGAEVEGETTNDGFSFTSPIRFHPMRHLGFELWPTWSEINGERVDDYEASLLINIGWISIKPGYRFWHFADETLEGPAIGLSFHW